MSDIIGNDSTGSMDMLVDISSATTPQEGGGEFIIIIRITRRSEMVKLVKILIIDSSHNFCNKDFFLDKLVCIFRFVKICNMSDIIGNDSTGSMDMLVDISSATTPQETVSLTFNNDLAQFKTSSKYFVSELNKFAIMLFRVHLTLAGFKLTMLVVIGTDCIGSYKSNYHMITTMTSPILFLRKMSVKLHEIKIFQSEFSLGKDLTIVL
jgi:hypothetical protein